MRSIFITSVTALTAFLGGTCALGINCRGSGLCPLATWSNPSSESIIQILRDAVWDSAKDNSTSYNSGDHIICVSQSQKITISIGDIFWLSGSIGTGGICLFPQGCNLTLGQIRPLTNAILEHGCKTCGSVPIHFVDEGSNDPSDGILTFNYVSNPYCDGNCISDTGEPNSAPSTTTSAIATSTSVLVQSPTGSSAPTVTATVTVSPSSSAIGPLTKVSNGLLLCVFLATGIMQLV